MKPVYRMVAIVAALVAVLIAAVFILGYLGVIAVPGVTPTILTYSDATELSRTDLNQIFQSAETPTISELESYGLTAHGYGTNNTKTSVENYYSAQTVGWTQEYFDSAPHWSTTIWRNVAYGLGVSVTDNPQLKFLYGYSTVFIVIEGPASAWMPLLGQLPD